MRSQCRKTRPQSAYECGIYTRTQTWFILHSSLNSSSKQDCASPVYRGLMSVRFMFDRQLGNTRAREGAPGNIKVHAPARTCWGTPCTPLATIVKQSKNKWSRWRLTSHMSKIQRKVVEYRHFFLPPTQRQGLLTKGLKGNETHQRKTNKTSSLWPEKHLQYIHLP